MSEALYTREILRLAADRPHAVRLTLPDGSAERRAPVCGSRVTVDVMLGADGRIADIGMLVHACALGQASAALLAEHAVGRSGAELSAARDALAAWLTDGGDVPDWPRLDVLAPALPHTARHAAIRLAFEAAAEAAQAAARARSLAA